MVIFVEGWIVFSIKRNDGSEDIALFMPITRFSKTANLELLDLKLFHSTNSFKRKS